MKKTVLAVTGSRAEYGILYPLLSLLRRDPAFSLRLAATGMHLSRRFGMTVDEIERDGFRVDLKVPVLAGDDSEKAMTAAVARGIEGFNRAFAASRPDAVLLLGDRFEIFAACSAAFLNRIPVIHLYGGEVTEAAIDDGLRHAITKMSSLHLVAAEPYRARVVRMGENPGSVFTVGALGLDNIRNEKLMTRAVLEAFLGVRLDRPLLLVTFHPVTLETDSGEQFRQLLAALDAFPAHMVVFTKPNADPGESEIARLIDLYVASSGGRAFAFTSLGRRKYLSLVKLADAVIGNSSSGIIEVPSMKRPSVNIGNRQKGRLRAASVIDCRPDNRDIRAAIRKALSPSFRSVCRNAGNPYGDGRSAARIQRILRTKLDRLNSRKEFYERP